MTRFRNCVASARQARPWSSSFGAPGTILATAAAVLLGGSSSLLACPLCFGAEETGIVDATKLGIVVMLAITLAVQGGFVAFFLYLRKRAKDNADVELDTEWSQLQRASRTS
jgi:heme/copper-type cytochrome/quinol oxidase subunit 2